MDKPDERRAEGESQIGYGCQMEVKGDGSNKLRKILGHRKIVEWVTNFSREVKRGRDGKLGQLRTTLELQMVKKVHTKVTEQVVGQKLSRGW